MMPASRWTPKKRLGTSPKASYPTVMSWRSPKAATSATDAMTERTPNDEVAQLLSATAVREAADLVFGWVNADNSLNFRLDAGALPKLIDFVAHTTEAAYPNLDAIPYHSRFRHFDV